MTRPLDDDRVLRALDELGEKDVYHYAWFAGDIAKHLGERLPKVNGRLRSMHRRGSVTRVSGGSRWLWGRA